MRLRDKQSRNLCWILAALLLVPQMLFPCCCVAGSALIKTSAPETAGLSPCCQQRLAAAQSAKLADDSTTPHQHEDCRCELKKQPVVRESWVMRALVDTLGCQFQVSAANELLGFAPAPATAFHPDSERLCSAPPDASLLCRWVI